MSCYKYEYSVITRNIFWYLHHVKVLKFCLGTQVCYYMIHYKEYKCYNIFFFKTLLLS